MSKGVRYMTSEKILDDSVIQEWGDGDQSKPHPNRLLTPSERRRRGNESKWTTDSEGKPVMPALQRQHLEWLLTPKVERCSQAEWCREHATSDRTVRNWRNDERFIEVWKDEVKKRRLSPEWNEDIIDALRSTALDTNHPQHVSAATQLIKILGMIQPPEVNVNVKAVPQDLASVSDAELMAAAEIEVVELARPDDGPVKEWSEGDEW